MLKRAHIRQFLAVVDAGSFTQAAARVRVTQPTLSVGIAELEKEVGAKLFIRDRKHVRITEAGARLLPIARQLEQGFRAAESLNARSETPWPSIRLGLLKSLVGPMAQKFVASMTDFELEIIEGSNHELRSALSSGRIDAAITLLRSDDPTDHSHVLFSEPYVMLVADAHPLAGHSDVPPEMFSREIMIARRSCERLQDTSRFFTRNGVRPRFALRSENDDLCLRMVATGLGITTAPLSMQIEGTTPVTIQGYDFSRTIGLVWANENTSDNDTNTAIQTLKAKLSEPL